MTEASTQRRLGLALAGIACSAFLLRSQLADALVIRGDEYLYRARPDAALRYYRRAIAIDAADGVAVDRFIFVATTLRERTALRDGIGFASAYLRAHAEADVVRMDRAMAYRAVGEPARALIDFARVGERTNDARALTFAGFAAEALGQHRRARGLLRYALVLAPGFPAARHALTRLEHAP